MQDYWAVLGEVSVPALLCFGADERTVSVAVGHDMGGAVAYALAAAYTEKVQKLAVLEMMLPGS